MMTEPRAIGAAERTIVALDVPSLARAEEFVELLWPVTRHFKIGMELYTVAGCEAVRAVKKRGGKVFLDIKFHDIPNTVAGAVRSAAELGVDMLTVHVAGGRRMMEMAARAADAAAAAGRDRPKVVGITVLTSMNAADVEETGETITLSELTARRVSLAKESGLDGVVCSPLEARLVKSLGGKNFLAVTPGIRPSGAELGDQARAATPAKAIENGADYIVVGRPVTRAEHPVEAARSIVASVEAALRGREDVRGHGGPGEGERRERGAVKRP